MLIDAAPDLQIITNGRNFSSSVIQAIQQYCEGAPYVSLAFFYFSYTDIEKQKASNFIRSILGQFIHQKGRTSEIVKALFRTYKHGTPPTKKILSVLQSVLELPGENFLIIDALDECPVQANGRDELCKYLKYLASLKRLHILVTGRKNPDLEEGLRGIEGLLQVPFSNSIVDADIRFYVNSQLDTNPRFRSMTWLPKVKGDILRGLESGSKGM